MPARLKEKEFEMITDQTELNALYALKIKEELNEIQLADHKDPKEFSDLVEVSLAFASMNGYCMEDIFSEMSTKIKEKGRYTNMALTNMNPENPSNRMYFYNPPILCPIAVSTESEGYFINNVGCLRYIIKHGTVEQSVVVEPEVIGEYLDKSKHEIAGVTVIGEQKYVFFKYK